MQFRIAEKPARIWALSSGQQGRSFTEVRDALVTVTGSRLAADGFVRDPNLPAFGCRAVDGTYVSDLGVALGVGNVWTTRTRLDVVQQGRTVVSCVAGREDMAGRHDPGAASCHNQPIGRSPRRAATR
jgi:hypothetical protein